MLIIIADRWSLKAFAVEDIAARVRSPRLLGPYETADAYGLHRDMCSDEGDALPNGGTHVYGNSSAERQQLAGETDQQTFRELAGQITGPLLEHQPKPWVVAAPPQINRAVLDELVTEFRGNLTQNLERDLLWTDAQELQRFDAA